MPWGDSLLCAYEGGVPYALDPDTLETRGEQTFNGHIQGRFLAHMKRSRGNLVGLSPGNGRDRALRFKEFDAAGGLANEVAYDHAGSPMLHDFAVTQRYFVMTNNPMDLELRKLWGMLRGRRMPLDLVAGMDEVPSELILVPRNGDAVIRMTLDRPVFSIHHANAYDLPDGRVVVDSCSVPGLGFGNEFGFVSPTAPLDPFAMDNVWGQTLLRMTADPASETVDVVAHDKPVMDFPRVHPGRDGQPCRHMVAGGRSTPGFSFPYDAVFGVDLDDVERPQSMWVPGQGRFVGEPVWIAPTGSTEDGLGWVVVMVYDGAAGVSSLCVLDPSSLASGPVARVDLPLMPHGFHGFGVSA